MLKLERTSHAYRGYDIVTRGLASGGYDVLAVDVLLADVLRGDVLKGPDPLSVSLSDDQIPFFFTGNHRSGQ